MLSYVYLGTNDLQRAIRFYDAALGALGMQRCVTHDPAWDRVSAGWGLYEDDGIRELAVWVGLPFNQDPATIGNGTMLAHGGSSEGAPGFRPHYNADFYAAYVRDPDGNKLAAVCRGFS